MTTQKKISIAYSLTAAANANSTTTIFTVPAACTFRVTSVYIHFPAGTYYELQLRLLRGIQQIAPYSGYYVGDASVIEDEDVSDLASGDHLNVYYKNTSSTQTRQAFIIVRGVLES